AYAVLSDRMDALGIDHDLVSSIGKYSPSRGCRAVWRAATCRPTGEYAKDKTAVLRRDLREQRWDDASNAMLSFLTDRQWSKRCAMAPVHAPMTRTREPGLPAPVSRRGSRRTRDSGTPRNADEATNRGARAA